MLDSMVAEGVELHEFPKELLVSLSRRPPTLHPACSGPLPSTRRISSHAACLLAERVARAFWPIAGRGQRVPRARRTRMGPEVAILSKLETHHLN